MKLVVKKSALSGTVAIPASKSHTIRAVVIASLAEGISKIHNPLVSNDTISAAGCYRAFGADINTENQYLWLINGTNGNIKMPSGDIDVGNSGTTLRLGMGSAALTRTKGSITLTGDQQTCSRPIAPLMRSLADLGADAQSLKGNNKAPVRISGTLHGGKTAISCATSQYLSSLLLACPLADNNTDIEVLLLNEPDYVRMTLDWLDRQNIIYQNDNLRHIKINGAQKYRNFETAIPADFSSATFFLCAAAILEADITITGLEFSDSQPDKAVVDYLRKMGADITINNAQVRVKSSTLRGVDIDMNRTPDAVCAMAVAGMFAQGTTRLLNVPQARSKETDRIACMARELEKTKTSVEELPDGLIIHQNKKPCPGLLDGHGDHRIVMALSIAGMAIDGTTVIDTAEAMNVTFPGYTGLMQKLGAKLELTS